MKERKFTRRQVIATTSAGAFGALINWPVTSFGIGSSEKVKLAINGGEKVHPGTWPNWPVWDQSAEPGIIEMLRSGRWWRGTGEHVEEFEKIIRNSLISDILGQYYQVLYTRGLESASKMQLDLSEKQQFRIRKMVETGKEALARQYEIESQYSADKLSYTIAHNTASQAITTLKQMLRLDPGSDFDVVVPDINKTLIADYTFSTDSVYKLAAQNLPRLKEIEFELNASKKQIAAARGNLAPRLTAGAFVLKL